MVKTTPADLEKPTNLNAARLIIHPLRRAGFAGDVRPSEAVSLSRFPFLDCAEGVRAIYPHLVQPRPCCAIDDVSTGIPCDIVFAEDIAPERVQRMLGEARLGRMGYALSVARLDDGQVGMGRP